MLLLVRFDLYLSNLNCNLDTIVSLCMLRFRFLVGVGLIPTSYTLFYNNLCNLFVYELQFIPNLQNS